MSLRHPFSQTSVTESWQPNFELCEKKLAPLGITVRKTEEDKPLPFADNSFDLVLNRHDSYDVNEVRRVLKPGRIFYHAAGRRQQQLAPARFARQ